ncbi:cell division protein FtsQ/DivIB [Salinimicrobium terrae]|uniref:cell division protein FtsQ/DivIB n=1 Tax=Salinimicrobium terrae TaxID=470866 RepID=UPI00048D6DBF|nr:cell division protein FtsQ/DivIB [Salinimicrobium terrae]
MKINWNYIKTFLLIGVVFFLFAFAEKRNSARVLSEVNLNFTNSENLYLTEEAVNKLLIVNEVKVKSIGKETLDLSRVETLLESHEMVESAEVFLTIDGKMGAEITQRKPLGRVMASAPFYIDRQGYKMPLSKYHSARVPLVTGVNEKNLVEIHPLMNYINNDEFLTRHVTQLNRLPNGKFEIYLRQLDFVVVFGEVKDIEKKFKNFKAFYQKALKDKKLDAYQKVDLQFGDQVVCTKK